MYVCVYTLQCWNFNVNKIHGEDYSSPFKTTLPFHLRISQMKNGPYVWPDELKEIRTDQISFHLRFLSNPFNKKAYPRTEYGRGARGDKQASC